MPMAHTKVQFFKQIETYADTYEIMANNYSSQKLVLVVTIENTFMAAGCRGVDIFVTVNLSTSTEIIIPVIHTPCAIYASTGVFSTSISILCISLPSMSPFYWF